MFTPPKRRAAPWHAKQYLSKVAGGERADDGGVRAGGVAVP